MTLTKHLHLLHLVGGKDFFDFLINLFFQSHQFGLLFIG